MRICWKVPSAACWRRGYARTTVRDIVAASGTYLASIGYHYGSKEALLNQAFMVVTEEWGNRVLSVGKASATGDSSERFRSVLAAVIDSFGEHRPVWALQFEIIARSAHDFVAGLREIMGEKA